MDVSSELDTAPLLAQWSLAVLHVSETSHWSIFCDVNSEAVAVSEWHHHYVTGLVLRTRLHQKHDGIETKLQRAPSLARFQLSWSIRDSCRHVYRSCPEISPSFFVFADVCSSSYNASYIRTKSDTQQDEKDYWKIKKKQIKASVSASFLIPALVNIFSYWVTRQMGNCQCVTITSQVLNQDMNKTNNYDYYQTNEIILKEWVVTSI